MARRSAQSAFAPDAFVFPGGAIEPQDRSPELQARTIGLDEFEDPLARALRVTAIRELFEEAGVLLAATPGDEHLATHSARDGAANFAEALDVRGCYADARRLIPFSHWITPSNQTRRFDTHFFLAAAPEDQIARADAVETHDGIWITAASALAEHRAGRLHAIFPTRKHLERIVTLGSLDEAIAFARNKPIRTVEPIVAGADFTIPEGLDGVW